MNGVLDNQTSGSVWEPSIRSMLHERVQEQLDSFPVPKQRSVLDDFERQTAQSEREFLALQGELRKLYVGSSDPAVIAFLSRYRALPTVLIEARPHLHRIFGDTVFALRASSDEFGWNNLYVDALWPGEATEVFVLLDRFMDEWWIAHSRSARGALTFTYRLI